MPDLGAERRADSGTKDQRRLGELPLRRPFCIHLVKPDNSGGVSPETLFDFQLRVARRADEIAQVRARDSGLNLHCWLLAEREVLNEKLTDWLEEAPSGAPGVEANLPSTRPNARR